MQCGPWVGSEETGEMLAVTVHSVEGNGSRVGPWAPPPPSSHRVSQRCRPLPPNLGVAPSHRPPKGLRGKARSQWEARPFRAASAGRDLIPHGAARPPANGSCWQSAACSRAPHGDLGPGPHLGLRRCQPGWPGAGRPSGATAPTRLGPGPPTHAGGGGAGRGGGGWNSAGLQETDAPRGSGWQGSSGPGCVEAPHPPRPPPVPQRQAGGGPRGPRSPVLGSGTAGEKRAMNPARFPLSRPSRPGTAGIPVLAEPLSCRQAQGSHACCPLPRSTAPGLVWGPRRRGSRARSATGRPAPGHTRPSAAPPVRWLGRRVPSPAHRAAQTTGATVRGLEAGARDAGVGGRLPPRPPAPAGGRRLLLWPRVVGLGACLRPDLSV